MKQLVGLILCFLAVVVSSNGMAVTGPELSATGISISGDGSETRVEIQFNGDPQFQTRLLSGPHRLIIDLPQTLFAFEGNKIPETSLISTFRAGLMHESRSRMIFGIKGPFALSNLESRLSADGVHQVLGFVVKPAPEEAFRQSLSDQMVMTASTTTDKGDRVVQRQEDDQYTIIIDPGHGGIDSGATGIKGTAEKDVTLGFAKDLKAALLGMKGIKVFLTREDDRFIALDERVRIARQLGGDLFLSIHADSISDKRLRGATVYTLSDKASDEVAQAVAQNENLADAIGGVDVPVDDHVVADILIDLTRRETMQFSVGFARHLVDLLKDKTHLINNSHRSAGFRVLKAHDMPSVLLELGYLSNEADETQIADESWRKSIAGEVAKAISMQVQMAQSALR